METKELKLSERISVKVCSLNGLEAMQADAYLGNAKVNGFLLGKVYGVCAIRAYRIGGETAEWIPCVPVSEEPQFDRIASMLTVPEMSELVSGTSDQFGVAKGEELKNSSTAVPSEASPAS